MPEFVAYYRVSMNCQEESSLGLDAQREVVARFIAGRGILSEAFIEIESGRRNRNRPQLQAALDACRKHSATLLIARLDRLVRDVAFIADLMNNGVDFLAVDMPQANKFTLHVLAAMAKHEREMTSRRTKAALQAARARGVRLGNPRPLEALLFANAAIRNTRPAAEVVSLARRCQADGMSLRRIAAELNRLNVRTPRGRSWYASSVKNLLRPCSEAA
jgi:DNA invertase Pin-like site-specific DNA recombinase